ncbi:hypothetical protein ACET3Z_025066 [Daucus carota]
MCTTTVGETTNVNSTAASGSHGGGSSKSRWNWSPELHRRFFQVWWCLCGYSKANIQRIKGLPIMKSKVI